MSGDKRLSGLALKVGPLGEHDRLLTLLSDEAGVVRLAVPGARKPRSSLAAAVPLTLLELQVVGRRSLKRVRQLQVVHNYSGVGKQLETLAAAQALAELAIALVSDCDPVPGMLDAVLIHLESFEALSRSDQQTRISAWPCSCRRESICSRWAAMESHYRTAVARERSWHRRSASGNGAAAFCRRRGWRSALCRAPRFSSIRPSWLFCNGCPGQNSPGDAMAN